MWRVAVLASALTTDVREAIALSRACGATAVQLAVGSGASSLKTLTRSGRRDLLKSLEMQQLQLVSLTTTCGRAGFKPGSDVDRVLEHLGKSIELAAELGRVVLCVDAGELPPAAQAGDASALEASALTPEAGLAEAGLTLAGGLVLPTADDRRRFAPPARKQADEPRDEAFESQLDAAWFEVGTRADRHGVRVAWRSGLSSWRALQRALTAAACPMFGADFDPVAVLEEPDGPDALEEAVSALSGKISHVRARDAVRGSAGRTRPAPLGSGSLDWSRLRRLLTDADFDGPLTVDSTELNDRISGAKAGLKFLNALLGGKPPG